MDEPLASLYNGEKTDLIPLTNRAFRYGDGVFETCAVNNQTIELWEKHYTRLSYGCQALEIADLPSRQILQQEIMNICPTQGRYILKIVISRGGAGRAYRVSKEGPPDRLISIYPWPKASVNNGSVRVKLCQTHIAHQPELAGIKHLNRLEQVMGTLELSEGDYDEGLLCDFSGAVISGTMSNLFCRMNDSLLTPGLELCGIAGTMREFVLELAKEIGLNTVIKTIKLEELQGMDGLFLTNSLWAIRPVAKLESRSFNGQDELIRELIIKTNKILGR